MHCPKCLADLIWSCDFDVEDENSKYEIYSEYHCPECDTEVTTYN